ncbi:iron/ascorbate family oxidoreductase [Meredithblackwellia eburnea MCA 4105]
MSRAVPVISLKADFENRQEEIQKELVQAAETAGFFSIVDHGISVAEIEEQFGRAKAFFDLPREVKALTPHEFKTNVGWEYQAQIRPSTGTADQKESLWLQLRSKDTHWPKNEKIPNFADKTAEFMAKCHGISMKILGCFSRELGFAPDHFEKAHQTDSPDSLTSLRLIHYMATEDAKEGYWRAGSHTDIGCLTLLFQRDGEDGLEICPGRESSSDFAAGDVWTPLPATTGPITINLGDMLMAASDDRLKSNFHRVVARPGKQPARYSIAYFNQAMRNFIIEGPLKKYEPATAEEYITRAMKRNFAALQAKQAAVAAAAAQAQDIATTEKVAQILAPVSANA